MYELYREKADQKYTCTEKKPACLIKGGTFCG